MERGERVDVTIHVSTHSLFIETFTQSLYNWNVLALTKCTLLSNNEIKQCTRTASVNVPFQNLVNVYVSCLSGC